MLHNTGEFLFSTDSFFKALVSYLRPLKQKSKHNSMSKNKVIFFFLITLIFNINSVSADNRVKKVFAHYLPWYDAAGIQAGARTGWCYEGDCSDLTNIHYSNEPRIGEYTQFDEEVVEYHLLSMFVAGIDGLIINVNPEHSLQKNITYEVLDKMNALKTNYANFDMSIILSYDNGDATQSVIEDYFTWMHDSIYYNPIYEDLIFIDDLTGKEVLQIWSEADNVYYHQITQTLWGTGNVLLMVRNAVRFDDSEGNFHWIGNLTNDPTNTVTWGQDYFNDFDWIMARQEDFGLTESTDENTVKMGAVYPGFNDENVPDFWAGGTPRYIQRYVDDGNTLELTWGMQQSYTPLRLGGVNSVENPWVQIVTWNDWPEGTSIEPATDATYGYAPLITCQNEISVWKGNTNGYTSSCLEVPYEIYLARKAGNTTDANTACDLLMGGDCSAAFAILPVEWISLDAVCNEEEIEIKAQVIIDDSHDFFSIETSVDGQNWTEEIRDNNPFVTDEISHLFYQINTINTPSYWRVKATKKDGYFSYSEIQYVECETNNLVKLRVSPNPTTSNNIRFQLSESNLSSLISIQLFDTQQQLVYEGQRSYSSSEETVQLANLSAGIYFLSIEIEGGEKLWEKVLFW